MKKSCLQILLSLSFVFTGFADASDVMEEVIVDKSGREVPASVVPQTPVAVVAEAVVVQDPLDYINSTYSMNNLERSALGVSLQAYHKPELEAFLAEFAKNGFLAKCAKVGQVTDLLNTFYRLGKLGTFAHATRIALLNQFVASGLFDICEDGAVMNKVLKVLIQQKDMTPLERLDWLVKSGAVHALGRPKKVVKLSKRMSKFMVKAQYLRTTIIEDLARASAFKNLKGLRQVWGVFELAKNLVTPIDKGLWRFLRRAKAFEVCKSLDEVQLVVHDLEDIEGRDDSSLISLLEGSELFHLCKTVEDFRKLLHEMSVLADKQQGYNITNMGKKASQEFKTIEQVFAFIDAIKAGGDKFRKPLEHWLDVVPKYNYERPGNESMLVILRDLKRMDALQRADFIALCNDTRIHDDVAGYSTKDRFRWFKCLDSLFIELMLGVVPDIDEDDKDEQTGYDEKRAAMVETIRAYTTEERNAIMSWPFVGIEQKSHSWRNESVEGQKLELLQYFQWFDPTLRAKIIGWLGRDIWTNKINALNASRLKAFLEGVFISNGRAEKHALKFREWLKTSDFFENSNVVKDIEEVHLLVNQYDSLDMYQFVNRCNSVHSKGLIDAAFVKFLLELAAERSALFKYADGLIKTDGPLFLDEGQMSDQTRTRNKDFYLFLLSVGYKDVRINDYFRSELAMAERAIRTRDQISATLGADHELLREPEIDSEESESPALLPVNPLVEAQPVAGTQLHAKN
jgi:hypothetical protein